METYPDAKVGDWDAIPLDLHVIDMYHVLRARVMDTLNGISMAEKLTATEIKTMIDAYHSMMKIVAERQLNTPSEAVMVDPADQLLTSNIEENLRQHAPVPV